MNKNLHAVKNAKIHHCETLALRVLSVAVASCFGASGAYAAGTGGQFVNGTGSITTQGNLQTIINSPNSIINWNGFSSSASETIKFIQQNASSAVLNRVVGSDPSVLLGTLSSNGRVFVINPNGVLFGATSVVNVAGLVASSLNISDADFIAGKLNFIDGGSAASVVNQGSIRTPTGGSVYLVAPDITNSGIITSPQGQVVLAAGHSVQLVDAFTPDLRVQVDADGSAVNVGSIVAHSGDIGIYGALITQGGKLDADTAVAGKEGTIILQASQDIDMQAGGVTTASGGAGNANAGQIHIIADGSLNVEQGAAIHVDGGKLGGNGGLLEVSGKHHIALDGTMTGVAVAGYRGGSINIDPSNIIIASASPHGTFTNAGPFVGDGAGAGTLSIDPVAFKTWADVTGWATVTLTADKNLTVASAIGTSAARFNHNLTLVAGNDENVLANIYLGTTKTLDMQAGNNINIMPSSNNALNINVGNLKMTAVKDINIGSAAAQAKTNLVAAGNITATAGSNVLIRAGDANAANGSNLDTSVSLTAGGDIALKGGLGVALRAGDVVAVASSSGVHAATATANVNLTAGGNIGITGASYVDIAAGNVTALAAMSNQGLGVAGANTAKATSTVNITAGKAITVSAGSGVNTGSVDIAVGDAIASAYVNANGGIVNTAATLQSATATTGISITAGTGITISANPTGATPAAGDVNLWGGTAYANAGNFSTNNGNNINGNNTANATATLALKTTTGNIALAATKGSVNVSNNGALASAGLLASGGTSGNTVKGNNVANATNTISLTATAGSITLSGLNGVTVGADSAVAHAGNLAVGGSSVSNNTLIGNQKATATGGLTLKAGGSVSLTAASGSVEVWGGGAEAHAVNLASASGSSANLYSNTITGNHIANATNGVSITATGGITISGKNGVLLNGYDVDAKAGNFATAFNSSASNADAVVYGNTLTGNNAATAKGGITLSAGGAISLTATNGNVSVDQGSAVARALNLASAYASNHATMSALATNNTFTGNHIANAANTVSITAGGAITLAAKNNVEVSGNDVNALAGNSARASVGNFAASNFYAAASGNKFTGNNTATAIGALSLKAGTDVTLTATSGHVRVWGGNVQASGYNNVNAYAYSGATASGNTLAGNHLATATGTVSITAGGAITLAGKTGVTVSNGNASASAYNHAIADQSTCCSFSILQGNILTGTHKATATNGLTLTAGGAISLTATSGDVTLTAGNANADAYNSAYGYFMTGNKLTGNNAATASEALALKAGTSIAMQGVNVNIQGGEAQAYAYNSADASTGSPSNAVNVLTGNHLASANDSITLTGASISIGATTGNLNVKGSSVYASAYNKAGGGIYNTTLTGASKATAANAIALNATGDMALTAGGDVRISGNGSSISASAYNYINGGKTNKAIGNNVASAGQTISLSAGGNLTLSGDNVYVYGISNSAEASAYNYIGGGSGNVATGNHIANASEAITLKAGKALILTATNGKVDVSDSATASASAYNRINGGKLNTATGNNTATVTESIALSGASIALTATGNVEISATDGADASAYNRINGGSSNKVIGNNIAKASQNLSLTATGAITIAAGGNAIFSQDTNASASAWNVINAGNHNTITGGNNANAAVGIDIKAGTALSVSGNNVYVYAYSASGYAYNRIDGGSLNIVTGSQVANADSHVNLTAGGAVTLAATAGEAIISANETVSASAYNYAAGSHNTITGNNAAAAANGINVKGASVAITATDYADISGSQVYAYAYNSAAGNHNTITGNNTATGQSAISITATAGGITVDGGVGGVNISNSTASASAFNYAHGSSFNKLTGNNIAKANASIALNATGAISITAANRGIYIGAEDAEASAYNSAAGHDHTVIGNNTATAGNNITIKSGVSVSIHAGAGGTSSSATISASDIGYAQAYNRAGGGIKNTVTGNQTANGSVGISITAPTISVTAANGVGIYGSSATAEAYNYAASNSNTVTGNHKATAGVNITLAATGALTIDGGNNSVYISNSENAEAYAYNSAAGDKNKLTGSNNASASNTISLTAGGALTISGTNTYVYASGGTASAFNFANNSADTNTIAGNHIATAATGVTLKAGGALSLKATAGNVSVSAEDAMSALAYNSAGNDKNVITGNNTASGAAALALSGSSITLDGTGDANIYGDYAQASAFNYVSGNSNHLTGNNVANAKVAVSLLTPGAITLKAGPAGTVNISDSNYAFAEGFNSANGNLNVLVGNNTGTALVDVNLTAGGAISITGGNIWVENFGASAEYFSNYANGNSNHITGNNTATATGNLTIKAAGAVTMTATSAAGDVSFSAGDGVYVGTGIGGNYATGNKNIITGNNTGTGTGKLTVSGSSITINAPGNIAIYGSSASATAYNYANGSANVITGNNVAKATQSISLAATGDITMNAGGTLTISGDESASAYAHNNAYGTGNKVTGNNTATADHSISVTAGGNLALSGGTGLVVYNKSASASAYNSATGDHNTITGNNTATANYTVSLTAGKALSLTTTTGSISIYNNESASATGYNYAAGASGNKVTGNNTGTANTTIMLSGASVNIDAGGAVDINAGEASAYAYNSVGNGSANIVTGNNTANAKDTLSIVATAGPVSIKARSGAATLSVSDSASAYGYNYANGSANAVTGNNTARAEASLTIKGASVTVDATGNVTVFADSDYAYAYNAASGTGNKVTGNNTGNAVTGVTVTATTGGITLMSRGGHVSFQSSDSNTAHAYNYATGDGNKITGGNVANANEDITFTAAGSIAISANTDVIVNVEGANASAYNSYDDTGANNVIAGNNTANARETVTLKPGAAGALTLTATNGNVSISAGDSASASAWNYINGGNHNTVTGNNVAKADVLINLSGSSVTIDAGSGVTVSGYSAFANSAYNQINGGSFNKVTGNNTVTANNAIAITATGDLSITARNGGVNLGLEGEASAYASNKVAGNSGGSVLKGNVVTGNNAAVANNMVSLKAGGNITVAATNGDIDVFTSYNEASASNDVRGDWNKIIGNNTATATERVAIEAGKAITISATGGDVSFDNSNYSEVFAHNDVHTGADHNTVTGNNVATGLVEISLKAGSGISVTGNNVYVYGSEATASGYNEVFGDSNTLTGNNTANATNHVAFTAGVGGIALTATANSGSVSISPNGGAFASAYDRVGTSAGAQNTKNKLTSTNAGNATTGVSFTTAGDVTIAASNINVYGASADGSAFNSVYGDNNLIAGANKAAAVNGVSITAGGNISLAAAATCATPSLCGIVNIGNNNYAYGEAYNKGSSGANAGTLPANTASGVNTVTLTAGKNISVAADTNILVFDYGSVYALASDQTAATPTTRGANVATATGNVNLTAGGALNLSVANGDLTISNATNNSNWAEAYGRGVNTATATGSINIKATGAVTIAANNITVYDSYRGYASATGSAANAVNTATANSDINVTGSAVTVTANSGNVDISGSYGASAYATGLGKLTATASENTNITATGALAITANGGDIYVAGATTDPGTASASAAAAAAVATAKANDNVTLKGGTVAIAATGDVILGDIATAPVATDQDAGGTDVATNSSDVKVQAGTLNLAADNIFIQGGSASMSGTQAKAEASTVIYTNLGTITTITGDLNVIAGSGNYDVAGIAATNGLTFAIAGDVNIVGGAALPYTVVNGVYTRTINSASYKYGTAVTTTTSPAVAGFVSPNLGGGNYTAFGITGNYTLSGSINDPVAFIQIK